MKKLTLFTLALALTVSMVSVASAMDHGTMPMDGSDSMHGSQNMQMDGAGTMQQGMTQMHANLQLMKQDVKAMENEAARDTAMKAMNEHMMDMHHGMKTVEDHAKSSGNAQMQKAMKQMNKEMMTTMKGMGLMKKDPDAAIPMMMKGLNQMESTMGGMKGMM